MAKRKLTVTCTITFEVVESKVVVQKGDDTFMVKRTFADILFSFRNSDGKEWEFKIRGSVWVPPLPHLPEVRVNINAESKTLSEAEAEFRKRWPEEADQFIQFIGKSLADQLAVSMAKWTQRMKDAAKKVKDDQERIQATYRVA